MRVLFLDKYCPGHFRHLASYMAATAGHEGMFLSEYRRKDFDLPGQVSVKVGKAGSKHSAAEILQQMSRRAEAFADALNRLKRKGFVPDVVCMGASSGCGLYVGEVFPGVPILGAFDYFHQTGESLSGAAAPLRMNNLFQLEALPRSGRAITGAQWQKDSFPAMWRESLEVLPEGVDINNFCPGPGDERLAGKGQPLITYISRTLSMESGFPDFYQALPKVLAACPGSRAVIVGYPEKSVGQGGSSLERLFATTPVDRDRVVFVNFCTSAQYHAILRTSSVHVFLSGPLVFSTGLLEAMSCGCLVVATDTAPVREAMQNGGQALLTPYGDSAALAETIIRALKEGESLTPLRLSARRAMEQHYNAADLLERRVKMLKELCKKG